MTRRRRRQSSIVSASFRVFEPPAGRGASSLLGAETSQTFPPSPSFATGSSSFVQVAAEGRRRRIRPFFFVIIVCGLFTIWTKARRKQKWPGHRENKLKAPSFVFPPFKVRVTRGGERESQFLAFVSAYFSYSSISSSISIFIGKIRKIGSANSVLQRRTLASRSQTSHQE